MFEVNLSDLGAECLGWQRSFWDAYNGTRYNRFEVYAVHKESDGSASFLLYVNQKWKWYPAIYFEL